jgi:hypothetical protein
MGDNHPSLQLVAQYVVGFLGTARQYPRGGLLRVRHARCWCCGGLRRQHICLSAIEAALFGSVRSPTAQRDYFGWYESRTVLVIVAPRKVLVTVSVAKPVEGEAPSGTWKLSLSRPPD